LIGNYRKIIIPNLTKKQQEMLLKLIKKYPKVCPINPYDIKETLLIKHVIPLTEDKVIKIKPYRVPLHLQKEVKVQMETMLKAGVIRPNYSNFSLLVVLVKRKDGKMRFSIDFRKLNDITRKDVYLLPRIDEMLDRLSNSHYFTTLDLQSGYWQIEIEEKDKHKTAFSCGDGLYECERMPFGLTGAPATFQRCMNFILNDCDRTMVYIDDIIVFSKTFESHLEDLEDVFKRLQNARLKIKPSKCEWAKDKVSFLGHIISHEGITSDPKKIEQVKECPAQTSVKQIQSFLG
jgi:hypothetical protein